LRAFGERALHELGARAVACTEAHRDRFGLSRFQHPDASARAVQRRVRRGDVVVGVSASGVTPFVRGALAAGRRLGAATMLVVCNPASARGVGAAVVIAPAPGPEVLAGSTRLKAGTATKLVLNTLTTASMSGLGRVHGNRMIDVQPRSRKLRERALRLVAELARVSRPRARRALTASGGRVRVAIVIVRTGCSPSAAARAVRESGGSLDAALTRAASPRRPPRRARERSPSSRGPSGRRSR